MSDLDFRTVKESDPKKHKKVLKNLGLIETNLRHPGLKTHKYDSLQGQKEKRYLKRMLRIERQERIAFFGFMGQGVHKLPSLHFEMH